MGRKEISDKDIILSQKQLLNEYDKKLDLYNNFKDDMQSLLEKIFVNYNIRMYPVKARVKSRDSLKDKIITKGKDLDKPKLYKNLFKIKDILGIRIVLYLKSDLDQVINIIKKEFKINDKDSVDKREHDHDKFGYLSSHLIVSLGKKRLKQTEYKQYKGCEFEIQIRTVLEDAWAETEHKLGYKSKTVLSYDKKRMLSRIAATLELIDESFTELNDVTNYKMTHDELFSFINKNSNIKDIDKNIKGYSSAYYENLDIWSFDLLIKNFRYLNIYTISDLEKELNNRKKELILFIEQVLDKTVPIKYTNGISLIYLCILIVIEKSSKEEFIHYLNNIEIRFGPSAEGFYSIINNCYKRMKLIKKLKIKGRI